MRVQRKARSITVWESKAQMDAAQSMPEYTETMKALAGHFVDVPSLETWRLGSSLFPKRPLDDAKGAGP